MRQNLADHHRVIEAGDHPYLAAAAFAALDGISSIERESSTDTVTRVLFPLLVLAAFLTACGGDDAEDPVVGNDASSTTVDPTAVLVRFYGGVPECYGAQATVVGQTAAEVRIRLEVGGQPEAGEQACIAIAVAQELRVILDAPVADRELVAVTR